LKVLCERFHESIRRHPVAWFFGLVFAVSWPAMLAASILDIPYGAGIAGYSPALVGMWLSSIVDPETEPVRSGRRWALVIGLVIAGVALQWLDRKWWNHEHNTAWIGFGVAIAILSAYVLTAPMSASRGIRRQFCTPATRRVRSIWVVIALGLPPGLFVLSNLIANWCGLAISPNPTIPDQPTVPLLLETFIWMLLWSGPLNEEPGWRGFAQRFLQRKYSPLVAGAAIGAIWGLWHLPQHFLGDYPGGAWGSAIRVKEIAGGIIFAWLYNHGGGSLLLPILFHTASNTAVLFLSRSYVIFVLLYFMTAGIVAALDRMWQRSEIHEHEESHL
jgi:membrane protease YdiL (CAAX protease family)